MTDTTAAPEPVVDETIAAPIEVETEAAPPAEAEQANEGEADDEEDGLTENKPRGKTAKDRIADLTRARRDAERSAEYWKGIATQTAQPSGNQPADKPVAELFDTYDDYIEAVAEWKIGQKLQESQELSARANEQHFRVVSWEAKTEAVRSVLTDFDTVVGSSDIPIAGHVIDALMDSDKGPELAYHMAQHPEIAQRLNTMSPMKAAIEMGRLETQLAAPVVRPASKAPAPVSPARGGSTSSVVLAKADMDTYIAERRKQGARY